jgi:hypothetical protein
MTWFQNYDPLHKGRLVHSVALAALVGILVSLQGLCVSVHRTVVK